MTCFVSFINYKIAQVYKSFKTTKYLIMQSFREWLITETIASERYPFKAVFMGGGPGSGKTWIARQMFVPLGFRLSNSDEIAKALTSKEPGLMQSTEGNPLYSRKMDFYQTANALAAARSMGWAASGSPYVIDTTGRSIDLIRRLKQHLESSGYDTYMVFVNTSLDTANRRNQERGKYGLHISDDPYVALAWNQARENVDKYQQMFGDRFAIIDNDEEQSGWRGSDLSRRAIGLLGRERQVQNPIGRELLSDLRSYYGRANVTKMPSIQSFMPTQSPAPHLVPA
jgi:predicted kinase